MNDEEPAFAIPVSLADLRSIQVDLTEILTHKSFHSHYTPSTTLYNVLTKVRNLLEWADEHNYDSSSSVRKE
jgi:hypothetical protein